jgi:hypothetical protein
MYWRSRIMPGVICAMVQRRGNAEAPPHHALGSQIAMLRPELVDRAPGQKEEDRALTQNHSHAHTRIGRRRLKRLAILFEAAPNQIRDAARWLVVPSWRTLTALCHLTQSGTHAAPSCITSTTIDAFHFLSNVIYSAISRQHRQSRPLIIIIQS